MHKSLKTRRSYASPAYNPDADTTSTNYYSHSYAHHTNLIKVALPASNRSFPPTPVQVSIQALKTRGSRTSS